MKGHWGALPSFSSELTLNHLEPRAHVPTAAAARPRARNRITQDMTKPPTQTASFPLFPGKQ